jgi:hypothetical protein
MTTPPSAPLPLPPPDERRSPERIEAGPAGASTALKVSLALLVVSTVVILAAGLVVWRHFHQSPTPAAQPTQSVRPAPQPAPTAPPVPASQLPSTPAQAYVTTPWGTRCQVDTDKIVCDTCEPGVQTDTASGSACPGPSLNELVVDASGAPLTPPAGVILPGSVRGQPLAEGQTYHLKGWTISVSRWVRFTNDATGHGMAVAAQNRDFF